MIERVLPLAMLGLLVAPSSEGQEIFSFDFSQDNTSFFEHRFVPVGSPQATDSQLLYDPVLGSVEPGSLRLQRSTPELASSSAWTPCVAYDPNRMYRFGADARPERALQSCALAYASYRTSDCSGSIVSTSINPPGASNVGEWTNLEVQVSAGLATIQGVRYFGELDRPGACNFDNVTLTAQQVDNIPALDRKTLAGLAALLAVGGLIALRSR